MTSILRQIAAVARINILSLPQRLWTSLSVVVAIGVVVFVLLGALALNHGFARTLNGSGSPSVALVLKEGAGAEVNSVLTREQQQLIEQAPGIARENGKPLVSEELVVIVDGIKKSTGTKANLPLRGSQRDALKVRQDMRLTAGRMFSPGSNEIVIGESVLKNFDGFQLGHEKRLGKNVWKVVGVFSANGSVFESELWADVATTQSLFNRGSTVQSIRARLDGPDGLARLKAYNQADVRLKTDIRTEQDFYAAQSKRTSSLIMFIGKPLALLMAIGALAGALNAMYASVASRSSDIATLRTIGFGRIATFFGTLVESLVFALIGAVVGALAALLFFEGMSASTLSSNFTVIVFKLSLTPSQVVEGSLWAAILGLLGGIFPAWRAARQPIASLAE